MPFPLPLKVKRLPLRRNKVIGFFLDLLFPVFCVGCKKEGSFLCASCKADVVVKRVPEHLPKKHRIKILYSATHYHTPAVRDIIAQYKYEFARDIAPDLTDLLEKHLRFAHFEKNADHIIVPVPLHARRARWRGFNQAELVAQDIAQRLGIPFHSQALARIKNTTPQIKMNNRIKRLENIRGAFACADAQAVQGKTVILVDDVTTTGGTLAECAGAVRQAGARSVIAFVVAS